MEARGGGGGMKRLFVIPDQVHGRGHVVFSWQPDGNYLATGGANGNVFVYDRHGEEVAEVPMSVRAPVTELHWDAEGEVLAIMQRNSARIGFWELGPKNLLEVDSGLRSPTFMRWARRGPHLAIGDKTGTLVLYNHHSRKRVPIIGKHSDPITCGAWSLDGTLALGSTDSTVTMTSLKGETKDQVDLKYAPVEVAFARQKRDGKRNADGGLADPTVSVNQGGRSILMINLEGGGEKPVELAFQKQYGKIVTYQWFGDGYMVVGFEHGQLVMISTHEEEMGEELFSGRFLSDELVDLSFSPAVQRVAVGGGSTIKIVDIIAKQEIVGDETRIPDGMGTIARVDWSSDGQILTVATRGGCVVGFLASMPVIHDAYGTHVAYLTSLREVSVINTKGDAKDQQKIEVQVEPSFVALGPHHVAVGMNNRVWFHRYGQQQGSVERDYDASVEKVVMGGAHAAVLSGGRVYVHRVEDSRDRATGMQVLPQQDRAGQRITCVAMTADFVVYGTDQGRVEFYLLEAERVLDGATFTHQASAGAGGGATAIKAVYPNQAGSRCVIVDASNNCTFYNPVDSLALSVPGTPAEVTKVMWDRADWGLFLVSDGTAVRSYIHMTDTVTGPSITQLGRVEISAGGDVTIHREATQLPAGSAPLLASDGRVVCQSTSTGKLQVARCKTHSSILDENARVDEHVMEVAFGQCLQLMRLQDAWIAAVKLRKRELMLALANKAMDALLPEYAIRVYRQLGDAGMVMSLEAVAGVEDKNLLAGHMAMLFAEYDRAQELFSQSSDPMAALELRRDLMEWDTALALAETLAPDQAAEVAFQLGKQNELRGDHTRALHNFQGALSRLDQLEAEWAIHGQPAWVEEEQAENGSPAEAGDSPAAAAGLPPSPGSRNRRLGALAAADRPLWQRPRRLRRQILSGVARSQLRTGDVRRGIDAATELGDKALFKECGLILEKMKLWTDAADMFVAAELVERAASILVHAKAFERARPLMPRVTAPRLLSMFAKAMEATGEFLEALEAYRRARDTDAMVKLLLNKMDRAEEAGRIARETRSTTAARLVSAYCTKKGDHRGAIEFLLMAGNTDEAFELAKTHGEMELYVSELTRKAQQAEGADEDEEVDPASLVEPHEFVRVGKWYESEQRWGAAGRYYALAGKNHKALMLMIRSGEDCLDEAIELVGKAKTEMLTHTLIDFLMGETDGKPKDPNYIFKLYMALGKFRQAAETAVIIARQEQEHSRYKVAHGILFQTHKKIVEKKVKVPRKLDRALALIHSYMIVKRLVKMGDHEAAAKALSRVVASISQFEASTVPILTSAVIECQRAGFKRSATEYATQLMQPQYREQVAEKLRRRIEGLVRRPGKEDKEEEVAPCPVCAYSLPCSALDCPNCRTRLPYCVITGKHMTIDDWSCCPRCDWPAKYSALGAFVENTDGLCPMCDQTIAPGTYLQSRDPAGDLRKWLQLTGEAEDDEEASPAAGGGGAVGGAGASADGGDGVDEADDLDTGTGLSGAAAAAAAAMGL